MSNKEEKKILHFLEQKNIKENLKSGNDEKIKSDKNRTKQNKADKSFLNVLENLTKY